MTIDDVDPVTMDPHEFARAVKVADSDELNRLMQGERRTRVLEKIFTDMPGVFRADRAGSLDAVLHWQIGDRPDGGSDTYELVISQGTCRLSPAPEQQPQLRLAIGAVDFLRMVTGNANPLLLFMRGRLRAKGDLQLVGKVPGLFDVPKV